MKHSVVNTLFFFLSYLQVCVQHFLPFLEHALVHVAEGLLGREAERLDQSRLAQPAHLVVEGVEVRVPPPDGVRVVLVAPGVPTVHLDAVGGVGLGSYRRGEEKLL